MPTTRSSRVHGAMMDLASVLLPRRLVHERPRRLLETSAPGHGARERRQPTTAQSKTLSPWASRPQQETNALAVMETHKTCRPWREFSSRRLLAYMLARVKSRRPSETFFFHNPDELEFNVRLNDISPFCIGDNTV
ncbi:hypothetical protein H310_07722 [Aphanomyces invadans]|uniref:Uncharacterized protein n=1 Tax=Aphanomyces invadans TaxID=157072 RepID=A0A024U061_9STRA|nr:hypothetical protein H310_07722 [Aphanomyces invadans]ETV99653.1 hypothetical protein H310_07722 [Aphanomyces invadans]|eukprot:XP_008871429.1 hypothetical protein H310_07722 [Aphanomyces invadans]